MGFSRQECWSGFLGPPPGDLPGLPLHNIKTEFIKSLLILLFKVKSFTRRLIVTILFLQITYLKTGESARLLDRARGRGRGCGEQGSHCQLPLGRGAPCGHCGRRPGPWDETVPSRLSPLRPAALLERRMRNTLPSHFLLAMETEPWRRETPGRSYGGPPRFS